jgi:hypothetical protein
MGVENFGIDAIGSSVDWFEGRLVERGICLDGQCALRQGLRALARRAEMAQAKLAERMTIEAALHHLGQATGADTLTKVLHRGERAGLTQFRRHWRSLKGGNPLVTAPSYGHCQKRTRCWELVLASLCANFCEQVLDEEPDIVAVRQQMRLGIAAKMLFTSTKSALLSRIEEGIDQLERSAIDAGIVAINLTDVYPHEQQFVALHRMRYKHPSTLHFAINCWVDDFVETYGPTRAKWTALTRKQTKVMAIAFFLPTVMTYWAGHVAVPMTLYQWTTFCPGHRDAEAKDFLTRLQDAYQTSRVFRE